MKRAILILITALVILPTGGISAAEPASNQGLQELDKMPEPIGGMTAIMQHVAYPKPAIRDGIEGRVLLTVVIDSAGQVKSVEVMEGLRSDLNQAAMKGIRESSWSPAEKDGRPVESSVVVPIQFKLEKKSR